MEKLANFKLCKMATSLGFNEVCINTFTLEGDDGDAFSNYFDSISNVVQDKYGGIVKSVVCNTNSMLYALKDVLLKDGQALCISRPTLYQLSDWVAVTLDTHISVHPSLHCGTLSFYCNVVKISTHSAVHMVTRLDFSHTTGAFGTREKALTAALSKVLTDRLK